MPQGHPTSQSVRHESDTSMEEGQLKSCHRSEQQATDRAPETPVSEAGDRQRSLQRAGRRKEKKKGSKLILPKPVTSTGYS